MYIFHPFRRGFSSYTLFKSPFTLPPFFFTMIYYLLQRALEWTRKKHGVPFVISLVCLFVCTVRYVFVCVNLPLHRHEEEEEWVSAVDTLRASSIAFAPSSPPSLSLLSPPSHPKVPFPFLPFPSFLLPYHYYCIIFGSSYITTKDRHERS